MRNLDKFREFLILKGFHRATVDTYCSTVSVYLKQGYRLTSHELCRWKEEEMKRVAISTVATRIHAMNKYSEFMKLDYKLLPIKFQVPVFVDSILTVHHYEKLLSGLKQSYPRWYCIARLLATTGLRISEAIQVSKKDVENGYSDILGKGSKTRRIWFTKSFVSDCLPLIETDMVIFCSQRLVRAKLKRFAVLYHIPKEVMHPHEFRAFFARQAYEKTKDIQLTKTLMGHSNINTTMRYLRKTSRSMERRINSIITW